MTDSSGKPLRLWPGVVIVILTWGSRYGIPIIAPEWMIYGALGGFIGALAVMLWWLFLSRAQWSERLGAIGLTAAALYATRRFLHVSIATGAQGMLYPLLALPVLSMAFVFWAVITRNLSNVLRRATMAVTILAACGGWALVRTGGLTANFDNDLHWRWTRTPEELLIAQSIQIAPANPTAVPPPTPENQANAEKNPREELKGGTGLKARPMRAVAGEIAPSATMAIEWPGFRGPGRDAVVPRLRIDTDWNATPPRTLWRHPIGPGWSSFAIRGGLVYTQEQRGPEEQVACYRLTTGEPVWSHRDTARFYESNGGAGPRGTPTLSQGRVYCLGATGILNVLDADNGAVLWSRDAASDTAMKVPQWGFSGSPLVIGNLVVIAASGRLAAYDTRDGSLRWLGPARGASYSSPHLLTIDGITQVLLLSETGATSVALADGTLLWEYSWKGYPIVQPALAANGDILISVSDKSGLRCITVAHGTGGWKADERWTSTGLKPYFNDFVLHKGHAYGFDGSILSCIDLRDGSRKWKGGRYGNGQLLLLQSQDLLLVLSEEGELALVRASPDGFTEIGRYPAIEGKTWNHPVVAGNLLLVRNAQEMAAFKLAPAIRPQFP